MAKKTTTTKPTSTSAAKATGTAHRILLRALLSEKTAHAESKGAYTFAVDIDATKPAIMRAVTEVYGVRPVAVRTSITEGKAARFGRFNGRRRDWKKAVVTLPEGKTISIHTGV